MVHLKSRRRPRRLTCSRRTSRARIVRASRAASARVAATSSGSAMWRRSVTDKTSVRDAPSRRPRPSAVCSAPSSLRRSIRSGRPSASCGTCACASRRAGARLAPGAPDKICRCRMPSPRQYASKISSKRSQSEWVAQNSARSAGFSDVGRSAAGDASTASASLVSARPTWKPLERSVRAKPASRRRMGAARESSRSSPRRRGPGAGFPLSRE